MEKIQKPINGEPTVSMKTILEDYKTWETTDVILF